MKLYLQRQLMLQRCQPLRLIHPAPAVVGQFPAFGFRRAYKKVGNEDFKQELKEYKQKMSDMRKKHKKEYWEQQTQVENMYLDKWRKEALEKQRRDLDRWRTAICNISMHTKNQIKNLEEKEKKLMATMRDHDLKDMKRAMENKIMLDVMEIDSKKWPTLADVHQKVDENVILPQTILNYGEYQQKLQNLAFYAEQGDHESMQKLLDKEGNMEKKNLLLQPLFRDLKSMIKHMTLTEESKLLKEYMDARQLVLQNTPAESDKGKEGLALLEKEYARLLRNYKKSLQDPTKKLKTLQKRLEDMFQLVSIWTQYVEIIYMPESEIHIIDAIRKTDARPEETSYNFKAEEKEVEGRINTLFGKEISDIDAKEAKKGEDGDAYETVNEGMTTDTTEAGEQSFKRGELDEEGLPTRDTDKKGAKAKAQSQQEEEGILSDEEEAAPVTYKRDKKKVETIASAARRDVINTFEEDHDQGSKKKEEVDDDRVETQFNFGEQDIEQFSAKIQTKAERERERSKFGLGEDEDQNYVAQTEYSPEQLQSLDMQALNLFGLPLSTEQQAQEMGSKETQQVLSDLIDMIEELDEDNELSNFSTRKSFVYYDPYEPDGSVAYSALKYEDNLKLRASIVLDYYKKEVEALSDDRLTYADKERKKQVLQLIKQVGDLKIIDAQVLLRLYDLYRYRV